MMTMRKKKEVKKRSKSYFSVEICAYNVRFPTLCITLSRTRIALVEGIRATFEEMNENPTDLQLKTLKVKVNSEVMKQQARMQRSCIK